jgi:hypothetical protein
VAVPNPHKTREEKAEIKDSVLRETLHESAYRLQQKNLDASSVKNNSINHYGCNPSVCVDVGHALTRRYAVIAFNIHHIQMLRRLLDPENEYDFVWQFRGTQTNAFRICLILQASRV